MSIYKSYVLPVAGLSALAALAAGCGPTDLETNFNVAMHNYGNVTLGQSATATFTLSNTSSDTVKLGTIDTAGVGLAAPFAVTGGSCTSNLDLPRNGTCTINVRFTPTDDVVYNAALQVRLTLADDAEEQDLARVSLTGTGYLDCNTTPELAASVVEGSNAATARNQMEATAGRNAGIALTPEDGRRRGYADTYESSYRAQYDQSYRATYATTYATGYTAGTQDYNSCASGNNAGAHAGYADGNEAGSATGYREGYDYSYPSSYTDGYAAGYAATAASCLDAGASAGAVRPGNGAGTDSGPAINFNAPENLTACRDRGYASTYNPQSYNTAFNAAAQANTGYQGGIVLGQGQGRDAGRVAGNNDGIVAGGVAGRTEGFRVGASAAYTACYDRAYASEYARGADIGYRTAYAVGFDDGEEDGYSVGYDDGTDDALESEKCAEFDAGAARGAIASTPKKHDSIVRVYGRNQRWAVQSNGVTVSHFVVIGLGGMSTEAKQTVLDTLSSTLNAKLGARNHRVTTGR